MCIVFNQGLLWVYLLSTAVKSSLISIAFHDFKGGGNILQKDISNCVSLSDDWDFFFLTDTGVRGPAMN